MTNFSINLYKQMSTGGSCQLAILEKFLVFMIWGKGKLLVASEQRPEMLLKHPTVHRAASTTKNYPAPNVSDAGVGKMLTCECCTSFNFLNNLDIYPWVQMAISQGYFRREF